MKKNEETLVPETKAAPFNLDRYAVPLNWEDVAGRRRHEQQTRIHNYFVNLPLRLIALPIHKPVTKLMAFLYLEAAFTNSPTVTASYQRAKRRVGLTCSRKTFYRALDQLEAVGALTKAHVNGRAIKVMLSHFSTRP